MRSIASASTTMLPSAALTAKGRSPIRSHTSAPSWPSSRASTLEPITRDGCLPFASGSPNVSRRFVHSGFAATGS